MSRPLAIAAALLVVTACAKSEPAADTAMPAAAMPAPLTSADLMGTWEATGMPMDKDTVVVRFTMTNTGDSSTVVFASGETVRSAAGTVSGDSVVSTAGPFKSQVRRGVQVTTRMVMRKDGDRLVGVSQSKYSNGDSASFRITATKKP
jgi:hypothetical protein